jgi:DNA (cytosine-5)-methyltransferase 1
MAACGYDAEWRVISAAEAGAPHKRERVWIVAYPKSRGLRGTKNETRKSCETQNKTRDEGMRLWPYGGICVDNRLYPEFEFRRMADGIPSELDRLKCLGNAIVPQCAELIFSLPAFDRWRRAIERA